MEAGRQTEIRDGVDLGQLLARGSFDARPRVPWKAVFEIATQVAAALEAPVHGDPDPPHVVVGVDGRVRLTAPPIRGDENDRDVQTLGLVLLHMLQGAPLPELSSEAEHASVVANLTSRIADAGLPNEAWRAALRDTIRGMCAWRPAERLDATQARELLRAFADQAAGEGLEDFAARVVAPIVRARETTEEITAAHHRTERLPDARPDGEETTAVDPSRDEALRDEPSETHAAVELETDDQPMPRRRPIAGAIAVVSLVVASFASIAIVLARVPRAPVLPVVEPAPPAGVEVTVGSLDDTMQWIRITNAAGVRLVDGRPTNRASVPPGTYLLSAKVVGRPVARGEIAVARSLDLECSVREAGHVVCADRAGLGTYELVP